MSKQLFWFAVCAVLFGVIAGYQLLHFGNYDTSVIAQAPSKEVMIVGQKLKVYVADTPEKQERGLSGRESLARGEGMLFIFPKDDTYAFWMKDMHFPIDILWLDIQGAVVHIEKNVSPDSYPRVFKPSSPARFVLEVNAGFVEQHNVQIGNVLYSN